MRKKKRRVTVSRRWLVARSRTRHRDPAVLRQDVVRGVADERQVGPGGRDGRGGERRHQADGRRERQRGGEAAIRAKRRISPRGRPGAARRRPRSAVRRRVGARRAAAAYRSSSAAVPDRPRRRSRPAPDRRSTATPRDSSKIRSAMPATRASARPSSSASSQRVGDLDGEDRPAVVGDRELREREVLVPAQQRPVRLAQAVAERRREVRPDDRADRGIEDQGGAQVPPDAAVERHVPGDDALALDACVRAAGRARRASASMSTAVGHGGPV